MKLVLIKETFKNFWVIFRKTSAFIVFDRRITFQKSALIRKLMLVPEEENAGQKQVLLGRRVDLKSGNG